MGGKNKNCRKSRGKNYFKIGWGIGKERPESKGKGQTNGGRGGLLEKN